MKHVVVLSVAIACSGALANGPEQRTLQAPVSLSTSVNSSIANVRRALTVPSGPPGWLVERSGNAPWPTVNQAMTYDAARRRVFYSGLQVEGDTPLAWQWNGRTWTPVRGSPFAAAEFPAMAYDAARERVVSVDSTQIDDEWTMNWHFEGQRTSEWDGRAWIDKGAAPFTARRETALAYDAARGRVVLLGGYVYCCGWDWGEYIDRSDTWEWDGNTWVERTPPTSPPSRFGHAMAYDSARQRVVLFGGFNSFLGPFGDTWEWDGNTWTEIATPTAPVGRYAPAMAYDSARQRTVLFGGATWASALADTWEWDGISWVERPTSAGPPARRSAVMAYDAGRRRVVLHGGFDGVSYANILEGTWEWDGTAWAEVRPPAAPRGTLAGMAYDRDRARLVLLVDRRDPENHPLAETWEWDGEAWFERSTDTAPVAGHTAGMAYDEASHRVVVSASWSTWEWDGSTWVERTPATRPPAAAGVVYHVARGHVVAVTDPGGTVRMQTWEWDGNTWTLLPVVGPPRRTEAGLAYDRARDRLVLFGGVRQDPYGPGVSFNDTWEWDGNTWTQRAPAVSPPGGGGLMVYDEARGRVVHLGYEFVGYPPVIHFNTWEWDGNDWTETTSDATPRFRGLLAYDSTRQRTVLFRDHTAEMWVYGPIEACATATGVTAFSPGAGTDGADATGALGPRDGQAVSLGTAGSVVLRLVPPVADRSGTDLIVYETGARADDVAERFWVEVSADNVTYAAVMDCPGGECLIDLARSDIAEASFVRITDVAPEEAGTTAPRLGADIDALAAVHCGETCNGLDDDRDGVFDNNGDVLCDDGNACTVGDSCSGGVCLGGIPLVCHALDQCHAAGLCDPATGVCSDPMQPDETSCTDGNLCTTGDACRDGVCMPTHSGLDEPNPRTNGYYKRLCHGPHSGDQLTDADAFCVAQLTATFAGISTVAEICGVIEPSRPNSDRCDQAEGDLMVLALNICRATVCTEQSIDSQCGGNTNVGQSLAESDAILDSPSRNSDTCSRAKCLDEEINTGGALEMNSLTLDLEGSDVRLDWTPPHINDGTGLPSRYKVWRRVRGSLSPFARIGETTVPTFLDTTSKGDAFEYEITAVMNEVERLVESQRQSWLSCNSTQTLRTSVVTMDTGGRRGRRNGRRFRKSLKRRPASSPS